MSIVVFGSVRGAPGVTTTCLLVAGCLANGVVAEADLDGGVLSVRYGLGREPGLTTLAAAGTVEADLWRRHAQAAGGVPVLVGPDAPERAKPLWFRAGPALAAALAGADADVIVDAGRLRPGAETTPVLNSAALVVVLVRPDAEDLVGLSHRLEALRQLSRAVGVVLLGEWPYGPGEVASQLGVPVLGVLPVDRRAAAMLMTRGGSPRALARAPLARAARSLADALVGYVTAPTDPGNRTVGPVPALPTGDGDGDGSGLR